MGGGIFSRADSLGDSADPSDIAGGEVEDKCALYEEKLRYLTLKRGLNKGDSPHELLRIHVAVGDSHANNFLVHYPFSEFLRCRQRHSNRLLSMAIPKRRRRKGWAGTLCAAQNAHDKSGSNARVPGKAYRTAKF